MRGDSVRDFYAKTLAVMGLGLIAGAGAVVDYWPVARPLPAVDRLALLAAPRALPVPKALDIPLPAPVAVSASAQPQVRQVIRPQHIEWPTFAEPRTVTSPKVIRPVVARAMPKPAPSVPSIASDVTTPSLDIVTRVGEPVALVAYAMAPPQPEMRSSGPLAQDRQGQPGFIGGALKKTKDSIVRTGAATGASIADAFKGLFGAMKKVSPF